MFLDDVYYCLFKGSMVVFAKCKAQKSSAPEYPTPKLAVCRLRSSDGHAQPGQHYGDQTILVSRHLRRTTTFLPAGACSHDIIEIYAWQRRFRVRFRVACNRVQLSLSLPTKLHESLEDDQRRVATHATAICRVSIK